MGTELSGSPQTKRCRKCKIEKPLESFSPHKEGRLGRCPRCKECCNAQRRQKYAEDAEVRAKKSAWHIAKFANDPDFRERVLRQSLDWGRRNLDKRRGYAAKYRSNNPSKVKEKEDKQRVSSPEKYQARLEVNKAIKRCDLPPAWTMVCDKCQEAQAHHWHHHDGYDKQHHLNVIPMCRTCHGQEHATWN